MALGKAESRVGNIIHRKVGAANRAEAVARAREMRLLRLANVLYSSRCEPVREMAEADAIVTLAAKYWGWYSPCVGKMVRYLVSPKARSVGSNVGRGGTGTLWAGLAVLAR